MSMNFKTSSFSKKAVSFAVEHKYLLIVIITLLGLTVYGLYIKNQREDLRSRAEIATFNVRDFGAKGDGSTDDTGAFKAAITAATSGSMVYVPAGIYMIGSSGINLKSNITLSLDNSAIMKAIPNNLSAYSIVKGYGLSNIVIEGGTFQGERGQHTGTTGEWGFAIDIRGSNGVILRNFTAKDAWGDGVYVGANGTTLSQNLTVDRVFAVNNRRNGMSITGLIGGVITNSRFSSNSGTPPQAGLDLEPNAGLKVENVTIENSLADNNPGFGFIFYGAAAPVTNSKIRFSASNGGGKWPIIFHTGTSGNVSEQNTMTANTVNSVTDLGSNNTIIPYSGVSPTPYPSNFPFDLPIPTPTNVVVSNTPTPTVPPTLVTNPVAPSPTPTVRPTSTPTVTAIRVTDPPLPTASNSYGITVLSLDTRRGSYRILSCPVISSLSQFGGTTSYSRSSTSPISTLLTAPEKCGGRKFAQWSTGSNSRSITATDLTANNGESVYTIYYK